MRNPTPFVVNAIGWAELETLKPKPSLGKPLFPPDHGIGLNQGQNALLMVSLRL